VNLRIESGAGWGATVPFTPPPVATLDIGIILASVRPFVRLTLFIVALRVGLYRAKVVPACS